MRKLAGWFKERLERLWFIWLPVLAIWVVLCGLALRAAVTGNDASGWYQVAIELAGFPILVYGLFELRKRVIEGQWKPEISVGVVSSEQLRSEVREMESLPTDVNVYPGKDTPQFLLVVRNQGKIVAKSAKIELELKHTSSDEDHLILSGTPDFNPDTNYKVYVCSGISSREITIWAGDEEMFVFLVHPLGAQLPYQPGSPFTVGLQCRVWADGIDDPPSETALTVAFRIQGDQTG